MPSDRIDLPTPDGYFRDVPTYTADTINALRAEVERLQADGIHSCHAECPRLACVQRREIERLTAERDGLIETLRHIANVVHYGGVRNFSEAHALIAVRKLTLRAFDSDTTTADPCERVDAAIDAAKEATR